MYQLIHRVSVYASTNIWNTVVDKIRDDAQRL